MVSSWELLVIDSKPLQQKAQRAYQKAVRDLEKAKAESERFHAEDKPLFSQWLSSKFGSLLTEIRELQAKLFEAQNLVHEVQQEYYYGGHSSITSAYRTVLHRRSHPQEQEEAEAPESEKSEDFEEEERTAEEIAEEFWQRLHEAAAGPGDYSERTSKAQSQRLKELYRKLARRLHPDNGRTITPRESELWHKTQAAYEHGQIEVLETILTTLEVDEKGARSASVSTLMQLTASLKKSLRTLKRQLTALRRDIAWNFSQREDRTELQRSAEATLAADRDQLICLLTRYEAQIRRWDVQCKGGRKRVRAQEKSWAEEDLF
ncbi:MAG: J domain-containing protein [Limisphaerales bacterium]